MVGGSGRGVEAELEGIFILVIFSLHEDFGIEYTVVKLERCSVIHEDNETLIRFQDDFSEEGLTQTPVLYLEK